MAVKTLDTTDKNLVGAINEVKATADSKLESAATDDTIGGDGTAAEPLTTRPTPTQITTSDDGTDTLSTSSTPTVIVTGSGINHSINLGDATNYTIGFDFKIINSSSEFIHIFNSDDTKVVHIPPRSTGIFTCTSIATAAGVWAAVVDFLHQGDNAFYETDFIFGQNAADFGFGNLTSGTGSRVIVGSYHNGTMRLESGDDIDSGVATYPSSIFANINGDTLHLRFGAGVNALSDGTDDYISRVGTFSPVDAVSQFDHGIYFEYDFDTYADHYWRCITRASGTSTTTATTDTVNSDLSQIGSNTMDTLDIFVSSDGAKVNFWINGANVATHTTNIPRYGEVLRIAAAQMVKTAGTTERVFALSYYKRVLCPNTER